MFSDGFSPHLVLDSEWRWEERNYDEMYDTKESGGDYDVWCTWGNIKETGWFKKMLYKS
jgi:hypothetical protein